jgi:hypothetical protein
MGSLRFLVRFHGRNNLLVWGTLVICALLEAFLRISSLFHFLHPWILFLRHTLLTGANIWHDSLPERSAGQEAIRRAYPLKRDFQVSNSLLPRPEVLWTTDSWWAHPTWVVGDIPNRYTSDVVLNQQARVAHQGGMADCLPGSPVAGKTMAVLDSGAHGGSADRPMAGCLLVHA